jgi:hypothetical protein
MHTTDRAPGSGRRHIRLNGSEGNTRLLELVGAPSAHKITAGIRMTTQADEAGVGRGNRLEHHHG